MKIRVISKENYRQLRKLYDLFDVSKDAGICIAVGGDGTFVKAAKEFSGPILPIRADESNSIGYYADFTLDDIDYVASELKRGRYRIEKLANKLEIIHNSKKYYAVNEALMTNVLQEVYFKVYQLREGKKHLLYPYVMSGDGILMTSAIGSTAYNKSAGGPLLLSPNVFCVTFLNVDGPYRNPIVVDTSAELQIEIVKYKGSLRYDGSEITVLKPGGRFNVRLSSNELKVVKLQRSEDFADKLDRIIRRRMLQHA